MTAYERRVEASGRLDVVVADIVPALSRSHAARLVRSGHVTVEGQVQPRPSAKVHAGDTVCVKVPPAAPTGVRPQALPLQIVHEDADVAVIDKAAGMVVHPGPGHPDGTLVNALLHHLTDLSGIGGETRPGIVHRLDRGTSGLLVVAKHDAAHQSLAAQFADHSAGRTYLALCHNAPDECEGRIESHLARHPRDRVRMASTHRNTGRRAVTHWKRVARRGTVSLLRCTLETGRTHQVRVHLSEQGWPILGDALYARRGSRAPASVRHLIPPDGVRPFLHAWRLTFTHPQSGVPQTFESQPPTDFQSILSALELELPSA